MPRVKPEERKRAKRPKTRSGCRTCKVRRVKCDETKPACNRCVSTGRTCDGYAQSIPPPERKAKELCTSPKTNVFQSDEEARAFQYIQDRSTNLSGFYDFKFWEQIILPSVHEDAGIRHAVIALAAMHEDFERTGRTSTSKDSFALEQYNLAIRQHLDVMAASNSDTKSNRVNMASCIIFLCIEMLQGNALSALSLVKGAMKLLRNYGLNNQDFNGFLQRVEIQSVGIFGPQAISRATLDRAMQAPSIISIPPVFTNIREARNHLDTFTWAQTLSNPLREAFVELWRDQNLVSAYVDLLRQWTTAFEALATNQSEQYLAHDLDAIAVLRLRRLMCATNLNLALRYPALKDEHMVWDECQETFAQIVDLAEQIVRRQPRRSSTARSGSDAGRSIAFRFTVDTGIGGPLYDAARMCRDPSIRRRAIALLGEHACREGLWDGLLAAGVANRAMQIEEAAGASVDATGRAVTRAADIPGWARVGTVLTAYRTNRRSAFVSLVTHLPSTETVSFQEEMKF